jgi:PRTRC genetic system protein C
MSKLTVAPILRKFQLGMQLLDDPCPNANIETSIQVLSVAHPEIKNAGMSGPEIRDGAQVYSFSKSIGTKG